MNNTCLIGNINSITDQFKYLLDDSRIDVLASEWSSFDSCFHLSYDQFVNRQYKKCILLYDYRYGRYLEPDFGEPSVITEESELSKVCFIDPAEQLTGQENEWYMFKLFVPVHMFCHVHGIELEVIFQDKLIDADSFAEDQLATLGPPQLETREGFTAHSFHNPWHHEYVTDIQDRDSLIIIPGDSWILGYNLDTLNGERWHPGQMTKSFSHLVAEHFGSDLVVCGSTYGSNMNAVITFYLWVLHNKDFINRYQDVKIIFSSTTYDRDFSVSWNLGCKGRLTEYVLTQKTSKLFKDSKMAVELFESYCRVNNLKRFYLFNHGSSFHSEVIPELIDYDYSSVIAPKDGKHYNFRHLFQGKDLFTTCKHPNHQGNEIIANEIITALEGT